MDNSKINQPNLKFAAGNIEAEVNLFNGNMLICHPDANVGAGNYAIAISHIYNKNLDEIPAEYNSFAGKNWKLNIQQYVYKYETSYNYPDFNAGDYVYIDSLGYRHRFVLLESNRYYDTSGLGLSLTITDSEFIVSDEPGNKVYFDNKRGNIAKTVSCENSNIIKNYKYSDNKLSQICDGRDDGWLGYINFFYNGDLLSKITSISRSKNYSVDFFYDNNNLVRISKSTGKVKKNVAIFSYDLNGRPDNIVDAESKKILKIEYNSLSKIQKINSGCCKLEEIYSEPYPTLFTSNNVFAGNVVCGQTTRDIVGYTPKDFVQNTYCIVDYQTNKTLVENEKGIKTAYFLNSAGFTTAIMEEQENQHYRTLFKSPGMQLTDSGQAGNPKINGKTAYKIQGKEILLGKRYIGKDLISGAFTSKFESFLAALSAKYSKVKRFNLSFWMRNSLCTISNIILTVNSLISNPVSYDSGSIKIDSPSSGAWQLISIPFFLSDEATSQTGNYTKLRSNMTGIGLKFEGDFPIDNPNILIADVRVADAPHSEFVIKYNNVSESLNNINHAIITKDGNTETRYWGSSFFMTEEDIRRTILNKCNSEDAPVLGLLKNFDLIYNDGTEIMANVSDVKLCSDSKEVKLGYTYSGIKDNKYYVYTPGFYQNILSADDGSNTRITTEYIKTEPPSLKKRIKCFYISRTTTVSSGSTSSTEYEWNDIFGRPFVKEDAYGVKTCYKYDSYGNPEGAEITKPGDAANEILNYEILYESRNIKEEIEKSDAASKEDSYSYRENVTLINDMRAETVFTYDYDPSRSIERIVNQNIIDYKYNEYYDKLTGVSQYHLKNTLGYDDCGRLQSISTSPDGYSYRIDYNATGAIELYSLADNSTEPVIHKMLEKIYNKNSSEKTDSVTSRYYTTNGSYSDITTIYDKYGRIIEVDDAGKKTTFEYQDTYVPDGVPEFTESPLAARVSRIKDPYENAVYIYYYDDKGNPIKYTYQPSGKATISVNQSGETKTTFSAPGKTFTDTLEYDTKVLINPRLDRSVSQTAGSIDEFDVKVNYQYDKFGRCYNKTLENKYKSINTFNWKKEFRTNSMLVQGNEFNVTTSYGSEKYTHTVKEECERELDKHNATGRILKTKEIGSTKYTGSYLPTDIPILDYDYKVDYTYRNNRLEYEKHTNRKNAGTGISYGYNNDGRIYSIEKREISGNTSTSISYQTFDYEKSTGRLKSVNEGNLSKTYTYDNYGNPIVITNNSAGSNTTDNLKWTRGGLLSSYQKGASEYKYSYNMLGHRYKKELPGNKSKYYYLDGAKILTEEFYNGSTVERHFNYLYDAEEIIGIERKTGSYCRYLFVKDSHGSVSKIFSIGEEDSKGALTDSKMRLRAEYRYDAWGNCTVTAYNTSGNVTTDSENIAYLNPFRWKGYYYDTETGYYYINGRYYDPYICRYVNPESPEEMVANYSGVTAPDPYAIPGWNPFLLPVNGLDMFPSTPLTYDDPGEKKNIWKDVGRWLLLCVAAVSWILLTAYNPAVGLGVLMSAVGATAAEMLIGGWFSGWAAVRAGSKFWQGMEAFVQNNVVEAFAINLLLGTLLSIPKAIATKTNMAKCFAAGTLVLTEDGHRKIEDIKEGDKVWAYDEKTGESDWKPVVRLFRNETLVFNHVHIDGEEIICTPEHPFYILNATEEKPIVRFEGRNDKDFDGQWVQAKYLNAGDKVLLSNGKTATIEKNCIEHLDEPATTYNFEVKDFHTYYVGEQGICVHNTCVKSRIGESPALSKEAGKLNGRVQSEANDLVNQFAGGNHNPGIGTKNLSGNISYLRGRNGARVFFTYDSADDVMYLLGKASKANEDIVIRLVLKTFGGG